jgi:hypothetical protein
MKLTRCDECHAEVPERGYGFDPAATITLRGYRNFDLVGQAQAKKIDTVIIHHPGVLGDNYAELVANLDMLSAANLRIAIVPPESRKGESMKAWINFEVEP